MSRVTLWSGEIPRDAFLSNSGSLTAPTLRVGVIPYFWDDGRAYFVMGRRRDNRRLTDFGGGCKVRMNESPYSCLKREVEEEIGEDMALDIRETLESEKGYTIYNEGEKDEKVSKCMIYSRKAKKGQSSTIHLLIPLLETWETWLVRVESIDSTKEMASFPLFEVEKVLKMSERNLSRVFDSSILGFIRFIRHMKLFR